MVTHKQSERQLLTRKKNKKVIIMIDPWTKKDVLKQHNRPTCFQL